MIIMHFVFQSIKCHWSIVKQCIESPKQNYCICIKWEPVWFL